MSSPPPDTSSMPLLEHLDELRRRCLRVAIGVVVAFLVCFTFSREIFAWFEAPYREVVQGQLSVLAPAEGFFVQVRVAFLVSLFLAAPVILAQVWGFVSPGLLPKERRLAVPFVLFATLCFGAGGWFGYSVGLPFMLDFLINEASQGFDKNIQATKYVSMFNRTLLGLGLVFEMPVLALLGARAGLLTSSFLIKHLKHAVVIIAILAALITPSGDVPTMLVFAVPMLLLFLVSIGIVAVFQRRT
ncbi:MAG: twin-arginine translocase subunit TatC [Acidobacteriota bacterium]